MEREVGQAHAAGFQPGEQFGGEMQARGGRGHRHLAGAVGIDRLIALVIEAALAGVMARMNVGRQRHLAEAVGDGDDGLARRGRESHARRAVVGLGAHGGGEGARRGRTWRRPAAGGRDAAGTTIRRGARRTQEETLDPAAARPPRKKARRQDGGGVAKEDVAGAEKTRQVGENLMRHRAGAAVDDQQARLVAARGGGLRNQALGQRVIEEFGAEAHDGAPGLG